MSSIEVKNLKDIIDEWVIGSLPVVEVGSAFHSHTLQLLYRNKMNKQELLNKEEWHKHKHPIEECYFILNGKLTLKIKDQKIQLYKKDLIRIPSGLCHIVEDCSDNLEYIVIRAPPSKKDSKILCLD